MTPRDYQRPAIQRLVELLPRFGAAVEGSDTGVGKTYIAAFTAKRLGWPVAVVCPKAVIPSWRDCLAAVGVRALFIENVEKLKADRKWATPVKDGWQWALPERCLLIVDEAHRFSGAESSNAKLLWSAPKPVLMMSATLAESPLKMRALMHQLGFVHRDEWYRWCFSNGCRKNLPFQGLIFLGGEEVLHKLHAQVFGERGSRIKIADLGTAFPENSVETVLVPIEDTAALDQTYLDALSELEAEAPSAAVAMLRARQQSEHLKLPACIDMIDDLLDQGHSVAVFVNFTDTLSRLKYRFPAAGLIHGEQTASERELDIEQFQTNESRLIICMIQAGGVGISLHDLHGGHPRVSILFPTWSAIELRQALGRIHRNGGQTPCIQRILFADGTIEQRVLQKLNKKLDNMDALNDGDLSLNETND